MPAIIGPICIDDVSGGIVQFGDSLYVSPQSQSIKIEGSGSSNTGGIIIVNNGISIINQTC